MNDQRKAPQARMPEMRRPGGGGGPMGARVNREKPKNTLRALGRLLSYIGKSKLLVIALVVIMAVVTVSDLAGPALQGAAINTIKVEEDGSLSVELDKMIGYLCAMGVLFMISAGLGLAQGIIAAKLSQNTVYMMRNDLFKKISKLPIKYTDTHKHGDIMSRMTNDVENVSNAVSQSIASLISSILTLIGAFTMMIYYSWVMALIACITIPLTILVSTNLFQNMYIDMQFQDVTMIHIKFVVMAHMELLTIM